MIRFSILVSASRATAFAALGSLLIVGFATAADAEMERLVFDPKRTDVAVRLKATLSEIEARFSLLRGEVLFDRVTGEASGAVVVDARSGHSGFDLRDREMHDQVLESSLYPRVTLRPESAEIDRSPGGGYRVRVSGVMDIHGGTHPVEFDAFLKGTEKAATIDASLEIPYVAWGLKDLSIGVLNIAADVTISLRGVVKVESVDAAEQASESEPGAAKPR